ncbi:MAG: phosphatase PAP2 family protein [Promethearchaeota archaeon]
MEWKKDLGPLVLTAIIIIFFALIFIIGAGNPLEGDRQLFMAFNPPFNPADPTIFDYFFVYFSTWGPGEFGIGTWGFIVFGIILFVLSLKFQAFRPMRFMVLLVIVGFIIGYFGITTIIKLIIVRERPFMDLALSSSAYDWVPFFYGTTPQLMFDLGLKSFPSGHATTGFIFATPFILIYKKYWIRIVAIIYGFLMAYPRIFLGLHYPVDVFAGSLIGILTVWFIYILFKKYLIPRAPWLDYNEDE